ncbi:hypothetical protein D3C81_2083770 [compost metagenome]
MAFIRNSIDIHILGTHHEVHMCQALVHSMIYQLFFGHISSLLQGKSISCPQSQMTGSIFIEKCSVV